MRNDVEKLFYPPDAVVVGEEIVPHGNLGAVVAVEAGLHPGVLPGAAEELPDGAVPALEIIRGQGVQPVAEPLGPHPGLRQLWVRGIIELSRQALFLFGHGNPS